MEKILERLARVKRSKGNSFMARCPYHADRKASLTITQNDSHILLHCFAGCDSKDIMRSIGLEMSDLFLKEGETKMTVATSMSKGKKYNSIDEIKNSFKTLQDAYEYNWLDEEPTFLQVRYLDEAGDKKFATYHKDGDYWYIGKADGLVPLYNLNEVNSAKSILIVEGEKLVNMLRNYGITATCSIGGAKNASNADWTPLIGKPSVVMWRDYNEAGLIYQTDVDRILSNLNVSLRKVEVEKLGLNEGDDLEQYIDRNQGSAAHIRGKIYSCIPKQKKQPTDHLKIYLNKVYDGDADNLEMVGFPILSDVTQMFIPGSISLIYSNPGVGKSLLMQQIANNWTIQGDVKVKTLFLESSINTYLLRCLSRLSKRFDVLKNRFHKENREESQDIIRQYESILDLCGQTMITSDSAQGRKITDWNESNVVEFIKREAPVNDVLIIDPISRILGSGGSPVWEVTNRITAQVESILSDNPKCRIVFVHHPANGEGGENVSGGAGWSRFSHNQLFITKEEEETLYEVITNDGDLITMPLDRYIKIKKCRAGEGLDMKIGIRMSPDGGLGFEEVGRIIRKVKG